MFRIAVLSIILVAVFAKIPSHPKALKSLVDIRGGADSLGPIDAETFKKMNMVSISVLYIPSRFLWLSDFLVPILMI